MDAAERTTATYDGFISYSHAADGLLAPRLQSALKRFAKPWWHLRRPSAPLLCRLGSDACPHSLGLGAELCGETQS